VSTSRPARSYEAPAAGRRGASRRDTSRQGAAGGPWSEAPELSPETSWGWLGPPPRALFAAGWVLLPLRAFLGFTFCFAGLQKLANPAFFDASNPASIQSQFAGAARRSPIHSLIHPLLHDAVAIGVLIALAELAAGIGTLLGLWTRIAAAGGAFISFMLFLTISFHSSPYFTGSDIVFFFAWSPLMLAGSGGVLSLDALVANRERRRMGAPAHAVVPVPFAAVRRVCGAYEEGSCRARHGDPCEPGPCPFLLQRPPRARRLAENEIDRRTFAAKGAATAGVGALGLLAAGAAAALGRVVGAAPTKFGTSSFGTSAPTGSTTASSPTSTTTSAPPAQAPPATSRPASTPTTSAPTTSAPSRPQGTRIGPARDVAVGGAASFQDPSTGDPSLVVQPQAGTFLAFDAVCPHAGCTVEYDPSARIFVCPCHGSEFNGSTGAVQIGPATRGLSRLAIAEGSDGELYVS
jgi:thiosulfate dehydrogenase [quinone] large subunit